MVGNDMKYVRDTAVGRLVPTFVYGVLQQTPAHRIMLKGEWRMFQYADDSYPMVLSAEEWGVRGGKLMGELAFWELDTWQAVERMEIGAGYEIREAPIDWDSMDKRNLDWFNDYFKEDIRGWTFYMFVIRPDIIQRYKSLEVTVGGSGTVDVRDGIIHWHSR